MRAPAHIMQQTSGSDQAGATLGYFGKERRDEFVKPHTEARQPRILALSEMAAFKQRVAVAHGLRHLFIQKPFSNSIA